MGADNWPLRGLCRDEAALRGAALVPDDWFRETRRVVTRKAKDFCLDCPVMLQCLDKARSEGIPYGVFGGEDERERAEWWEKNGGRPTAFDDSLTIDVQALRPFEAGEEMEEVVA